MRSVERSVERSGVVNVCVVLDGIHINALRAIQTVPSKAADAPSVEARVSKTDANDDFDITDSISPWVGLNRFGPRARNNENNALHHIIQNT